eukprot:snap_masked-scaffold_4-processed-gene-1.12-mRNA-1 protein AED:1.00 eAED:1.00 QI:0/-1/0/0/-1/1/1/0/137
MERKNLLTKYPFVDKGSMAEILNTKEEEDGEINMSQFLVHMQRKKREEARKRFDIMDAEKVKLRKDKGRVQTRRVIERFITREKPFSHLEERKNKKVFEIINDMYESFEEGKEDVESYSYKKVDLIIERLQKSNFQY